MFKRLRTSIKDEFSDFLSRILGTKFFGNLITGTKRISLDVLSRKDPELSDIFTVISLDKVAFEQITGSLEKYSKMHVLGKEILTDVAEYVVSDEGPIARMFDEETGPSGPWQELSARQLRWRRQRGYAPGPILDASGKLREAVTSELLIESVKGGRHAKAIIGPDKLKANTNELDHIEEKFYVHMLGTKVGFGNKRITIPARRFMPKSEKDFTDDERFEISKRIKRILLANKFMV